MVSSVAAIGSDHRNKQHCCSIKLIITITLLIVIKYFTSGVESALDDSWNQRYGNSARSRHSHYFTNHAEWTRKFKNTFDSIEIESLLMDPNRGEMVVLGSKDETQQRLIYIGNENGTYSESESFIDYKSWSRPTVGFLNAVVDANYGNYFIVRQCRATKEYGILKISRQSILCIFRISQVINDLMTVSDNTLLIALDDVVLTIDSNAGSVKWIINRPNQFKMFSQFLLDFRSVDGYVTSRDYLVKFNSINGQIVQSVDFSKQHISFPLLGMTSLDNYLIVLSQNTTGDNLEFSIMDKKTTTIASTDSYKLTFQKQGMRNCSNAFAFNNSDKFGIVCSVEYPTKGSFIYVAQIFQVVTEGSHSEIHVTNQKVVQGTRCSLSISTLQHGYFGIPCSNGLLILQTDSVGEITLKNSNVEFNERTQMIGAFHNQYYLISINGDSIYAVNGVYPK